MMTLDTRFGYILVFKSCRLVPGCVTLVKCVLDCITFTEKTKVFYGAGIVHRYR